MIFLMLFDFGLIVVFLVIVFINIIGNSLVCLVVLCFNGMRVLINFLFFNLVVLDMMVVIFIIL